jgi:DNA-directed RNA polymerase subunit RPC12/RpoP
MDPKITSYTLSCPSCGAGFSCEAGIGTAKCAYCGSSVVVNPKEAEPKAFGSEDEPSLPVKVEKLVREGHDGRAVLLLRDRLSLTLAAAGRVVEIIRMDESADAGRLIEDAQNGELK